MDRLEIIEQFCRNVDVADDLDVIFTLLQKEICRLGFERFNYTLHAHPERGAAGERLYISSYPKDFEKRYVAQHYISDDMVVRYAATSFAPFTWNDIGPVSRFTDRQKLLFNESQEAGLNSGACVPMHGPGRARATLSVTGSLPPAEFTRLFLRNRHELHLIATYVHERITSLQLFVETAPPARLSPREIEILTWSARGKTRWDISQILSIAEETVKTHIRSGCAKLDVSNTTHAIAKAIMHGLITP